MLLLVLTATLLSEVPLPAGPPDGGSEPAAGDSASFETTVTAARKDDLTLDGRAESEVRRADLERRLPRSAPDALRFEPGVFVQQTAHAQGSAFLRGLTGQQTLLLFDGIRLNNSTYRQGPNQYFFTLDSQTLDSIAVQRGGASTRFGSDALGGVIAASPIDAPAPTGTSDVDGSLMLRGASADLEHGGRVQLSGAVGDRIGFIAGIGGRRVGLLRSGGPVRNPVDGSLAEVPRFAPDGRTQLGTGFNELTADARVSLAVSERQRVTAAGYVYRQYDAPRTDQCPPATARFDECLTYEEQFRTLAYVAWDGSLGEAANRVRATFSYQQQHERRNLARPASHVSSLGRDDVDTFGLTLTARTREARPFPWLKVVATYGVDTYLDRVDSHSWLRFADIDVTVENSRGQYLDGSTYLYGGAFAHADSTVGERFVVRAGTRASWTVATAPGDADSGSAAIDRAWFPIVGNAGVEWLAGRQLSLLVNADHSFRAPNLDDLTSRQQTGPGFQFENPSLLPERATTLEAGARYRSELGAAEAWAFTTGLDNAIGRFLRTFEDCPPHTPQCQSSNFRYQLVNADGPSVIRGVEGSVRLRLPARFTARATAVWTWGEGPNLSDPPSDPNLPYDERVPLSRIPPLNGTAEVYWVHRLGFNAGAALRWAAAQRRLAVTDLSDVRIPRGGTPGFSVVDVRAGFRLDSQLWISAVVENVFDVAYRYHGSSVNGPRRGVVLALGCSPF